MVAKTSGTRGRDRDISDNSLLEALGGELESEIVDKNVQQGEVTDELDIEEIGASAEEIANLASIDLDFLSAITMPLVFKFCFPPVFKAVCDW